MIRRLFSGEKIIESFLLKYNIVNKLCFKNITEGVLCAKYKFKNFSIFT